MVEKLRCPHCKHDPTLKGLLVGKQKKNKLDGTPFYALASVENNKGLYGCPHCKRAFVL